MLRWAIYLGVSWTWCIGMFLPVILVRDFGLWAFFAFAVPNVLGAAVMPFVLGGAEKSREMVAAHRGAMVSFSRVTIAYQAFFAGWMLPQLLGWWTVTIYAVLVGMLLFAVRKDREFAKMTAAVWAVSIGLAVWMATRGELTLPAAKGIDAAAMLVPVCFVGFLLCPYLDLTFHHALQRSEEEGGKAASRGAFVVGFMAVFGSMIAFTLLYAGALLEDRAWAGYLVGVHLMLQLSVTVVLHQVRSGVRTERVVTRRGEAPPRPPAFLPFLAVFFVLGLGAFFTPMVWGREAGEWVYRTFLAFYGLMAPAYVLLRIVRPAPMRLLGGAVLTALPFYAVGFYGTNPFWLIPGVGVLLMAFVLAGVRRAADARAAV